MTGAVVAAGGGLFPFMLDDFETNDFATKWGGSTSSLYTRDTAAPISGAASAKLDAPGAVANTAKFLVAPPSGMQVLRGDVVSVRVRGSVVSTSVGTNQLYLHQNIVQFATINTANDSVKSCFTVNFTCQGLSLIYYDGDGNTVGLGGVSYDVDTTRADLEIRFWFNSASHPTAPRACGAQLVDADDGSILTSVSGTLPGSVDNWEAGNFGYGTSSATKLDPCTFWLDNLKILSRAAA